MAIRDQLFSIQSIIQSWEAQKSRIRRNTTPGVDGVSRDQFRKNIEIEATFISSRVRSGDYQFSSLKPIAIPKGNGTDDIRLINVPTIRDRFVQRILLTFLAKTYGSNWHLPNSFSSMEGLGGVQSTLHDVANRLSYSDYVIKADLSKYFDNIDRNVMKERIRKLVRHRSLYPLLDAVVDCETSLRSTDDKGIFAKSGLKRMHGMRQGMPLSPVFAYLFLMDVDKQVSGTFYRYVDDLLFVGKTKAAVIDQFDTYKLAVEHRGLQIHPLGSTKTQLIGRHEAFEFLGIHIKRAASGNSFAIPSSSKEKIVKSAMRACVIDEHDKKARVNWVASATAKARGLVRYYKSAYGICADWDSFEATLRQRQVTMCRSIVNELMRVKKTGDTELLRTVFGF